MAYRPRAPRKMALRYPAYCRTCGKRIPAGTVALYGGKSNIRHIDCENAAAPAEPTPERKYRVHMRELKEIFRAIVKDPATVDRYVKRASNRSHLRRLVNDWNNDYNRDWFGGTGKDMLAWLDAGFLVQGLQGWNPELFPPSEKKKRVWHEDSGELVLERALAGADTWYAQPVKSDEKPGLTVVFNCTFSSMVDLQVIAAYQRWIARALQSIKTAGYAPEVIYRMPVRELYRGEYGIAEIEIIVEEAGLETDFASWSGMFAPTGFRMIGFLGMILSADFHDKDSHMALGYPASGHEFNLDFDAETNRLEIRNHGQARDFPEEAMTAKLREIIH